MMAWQVVDRDELMRIRRISKLAAMSGIIILYSIFLFGSAAHAATTDPHCQQPLSSTTSLEIGSSASLVAAPGDPIGYLRERARAVELRKEGKLTEAAPIAEQLVRQYSCDAYIWRLLGDARMAAGKPDAAANAYAEAMELGGPGTPAGAGFKRAVAYATAGDREEALRVLEYLVFQQRYLLRPGLYDVPAFANLRSDPRFLRLVGREDTSKLTRNEGWSRDLAYLVSEIRRTNPLYSTQPFPPNFVQLQSQLQRNIPHLSDAKIYVGLARLLASLKQGHTSMPFAASDRVPFSQLPVNFYAFPDGLYVVDAKKSARDLVGAKLISINGTPALEVLRQAGELVPSGMEALWTGPWLTGIAQVLDGLGIVARTDRIPLVFQLPSGQRVTRTLRTVTLEDRPKLVAPPGVAPPLFLRNVSSPFWSEKIGGNILYVQLNQIRPSPKESVAEFGLQLRQELRERPVHNLILDLRHDNGGNAFLYPELLRTLISFSAGERNRLYIIIGRWVYSAAALFTGDLERLAQPIFVGEPTSMTGNQFGDSANIILPYTGLPVNVSGVQWQRSDPWDGRKVIVPQIPAQLTAKAYFSAHDPALETIEALIESGGVPAGEMDPH
jgi:tetratricopeptide (TPR) repeat protein